MTADLTPAPSGQTDFQGERREPIALDSPGRSGLSVPDLAEALTALLDRYNPGNEAQRGALQAALVILEARDSTAQSRDHRPFETREEIGAIALETHAARLQKDSGFLTRDAPGVAEARAFAAELRRFRAKTPATLEEHSARRAEESRKGMPLSSHEEIVMTSAGPLTVKITGWNLVIQQLQLFDRTGVLRLTHPVQAVGRYLGEEYIRSLFENHRVDARSRVELKPTETEGN